MHEDHYFDYPYKEHLFFLPPTKYTAGFSAVGKILSKSYAGKSSWKCLNERSLTGWIYFKLLTYLDFVSFELGLQSFESVQCAISFGDQI